jgi:Phage integrase family
LRRPFGWGRQSLPKLSCCLNDQLGYSAQVCCSISYHGLRATELCALKWSQIDLRNGRLHVNRAKGGIESVHPPHGPELRALYGSTGNRSERSTPQHLDRISWRASTKKTPLIDDAPRGGIRFLPSPEKGKHWRAHLGCIQIDPGPRWPRSAEEGPGRRGILDRGLSTPCGL